MKTRGAMSAPDDTPTRTPLKAICDSRVAGARAAKRRLGLSPGCKPRGESQGDPSRVAASSALSRASVICALAETEPGAVSPNCEDEVVVASAAAPRVRAGKAL